MKKNKMMRVAAVMLVCVLLSTSIISGTFAKYVTSTSAGDSARVAKWGVVVGTSGALFATSYETHDDTAPDSITASVSSSAKVVAPGTSYADVDPGTGLTFSVSGTPEVAVVISFDVDDDYKDIVMPAATYTDYTVVPNSTFTLAQDYHPLYFTLKDRSGNTVDTGGHTLEDIVNYLESNPIYVGPGVELGTAFGSYTLIWEWVFDGNDRADTFLGQYASATSTTALPSAPPEAAGNFSHEVALNITITVTQVD